MKQMSDRVLKKYLKKQEKIIEKRMTTRKRQLYKMKKIELINLIIKYENIFENG